MANSGRAAVKTAAGLASFSILVVGFRCGRSAPASAAVSIPYVCGGSVSARIDWLDFTAGIGAVSPRRAARNSKHGSSTLLCTAKPAGEPVELLLGRVHKRILPSEHCADSRRVRTRSALDVESSR